MIKQSTKQRWLHQTAALALAGGLGVFAPPAFAQEAITASTVPSAEPANESGDIVVTAQRRRQRLSDVPISVQAQSGEQLAAAGVTDSRALESISPAISFQSQFSATSTSFSMRGVQSLAPAGGIQPSVGVVIDGVPVARQYEAVLELADIDRVEILSGPQGTLFGKNATAGVINIVSNRPGPALSSSAEISGTSDKEVKARAMLNIPLGPRVSTRFNVFYDYLNPLVKNLAGPDLYGRRAWGANGKILFEVSDATNLLLSAQYYQFSASTGVSFPVVPLAGNLGLQQSQLVAPDFGRGTITAHQNSPALDKGKSQSYVLEFNTRLSDNLHLVALTAYRRFDDTYSFDLDLTPVGGDVGLGFQPNPTNYPVEFYNEPDSHVENYKYWSQEARLNYSAGSVDAILGGYYQNYSENRYLRTTFRFDGSYLGRTPGDKYISDTITLSNIANQTAAAFGDVTVAVMPNVKVFGGLRYTHERLSVDYNRRGWLIPDSGFDPILGVATVPPTATFGFTGSERSDNNLSGRIGIQWQPTRNLNYYASYNRGYKGAAANVGSSTASPAAAVIAPETASAFEVGAKQRFFGGKLAIDLALYSQKVDNIQQTAVIPGSVSVSLINAGSLKSKGFELNVTARPVPGLMLNGGLVYTDAYYAGGFRFACGPSATKGVGSCAADGTFPLDGTQAIGVPKWKVVTSATYETRVAEGLKANLRIAYNWRTSVQQTLYHDPVSLEPSYGILDASIGVGGADGRWQVTLFVNNLTNKLYYSALNIATPLARSYGFLPRDFKRYGGLRLSFHY